MRELGILLVILGVGLMFTTFTKTTGQVLGALFAGGGTPATPAPATSAK